MDPPSDLDLSVVEYPTDDDEESQAPFAFPENAAALLALDTPTMVTLKPRRRGVERYQGRIHPEYELATSSYDSKGEAFRAWRAMQFPRLGGPHFDGFVDSRHYGWEYPATTGPDGRVYGILRVSADMECLQHPDGTGFVTFGGDTPAYVRTNTRLLLAASEDVKLSTGGRWMGGYEYPPRADHDGEVPLVNLAELDATPPLVTIERYERGGGNVIVHYQNGAVAVVLDDPSANDRDNVKAGFVLDPDEAAETTLPPAQAVERLVMPDAVESEYLRGTEIVTSDNYAARGGYHTADGWRHRGTGNHIIRQGEWYLAPKPEGWAPEKPVYKAQPNADRRADWSYDHLHDDRTIRKDAGECLCGATSWHLPARGPTYICDVFTANSFPSGTHVVGADAPVTRVLFFAADERLDSHNPRDLSFDADDTLVVRGSFRHVDNEHAMCNVDDRWHEVHENTRDMTVFSYRRGRYGSRSRRGGMRVE
jgi:hypothetical protein